MEIIARDYRQSDASQLVETYRDSFNTLRAAKGGMHTEHAADYFVDRPDDEIMHELAFQTHIIIAEVNGTGEMAGFSSISMRRLNRLAGSTIGCGLYVRERFQRGKSGVNVGSMLKNATYKRAAELGFRKYYSYSVPEAIRFHKKSGAVFYPYFRSKEGMTYHYYEVELRKSALNSLRIEPYIATITDVCLALLGKR